MSTPQKKLEVITIESPLDGLISDFSPAPNPIEGGKEQYRYAFGTTVMRPGYKGHIAPSEIFDSVIMSDPGSVLTTLPRSAAAHIPYPAGTGNALVLAGSSGTAPRVVTTDNSYATTSSHTPAASSGANFTTLPATGTWGEDVIFYTSFLGSVGTYVDAVFYSYNDSVKGSIGFLDYSSGLSWNDDFTNSGGPGVVLAAGSDDHLLPGVPHRMCVGPDKILYITNGQFIASFDGTKDQSGAYGTFNSFALDLGPGWIVTDIQPYQTYLAISITQMGESFQPATSCKDSRVILWDGFSLDFNQVYPLNDWYVSALYASSSSLFAFTQGVNGTTKVKMLPLNLPAFSTVFEMPTANIGNAPLPNQIEYFNDMIQWASSTFQVLGLLQTATGFAAHTTYYLSDGTHTGVNVGFLKSLNANILFAGFQSGAGFEVIGVVGDGTSHSLIASLSTGSYLEHRTPLIDIGYKANIKHAIAYFSSFGSASSALVSLIPNRTAYAVDGSGNITNDALAWTVSTTNHPNIASTFTASTRDFGKSLIKPDVTQFWMNIRTTNTVISDPPPIFRKLELYIEPSDQP